MNKLYFPIASYNLSNYFRTGLVTPTRFISNRNKDIQNEFQNSLLLSSRRYTDETDCSLEIVLTIEEEKILQRISDHFSVFNGVLPITRIKNIYFKDEEQKNKTIWNIRDGAAFIPESIVSDSKKDDLASVEELRNLKVRETANKDFIEKKIKLYDRLLGGFALMRLGGENWMNFSTNYFPSISLLNERIKTEWENSDIPGENRNEWLILKRENSSKKTDIFAKEAVYADASLGLVERYAKEEKILLEKKLGVIQIDSIEPKSFTYLASILAIYDENGRKKIDDFIHFLMTEEFDLERKEGIALMFGINKGYKAFRNKYRAADFDVEVKFRLESQLEYYIVESIYQYAFNGRRNNLDFQYLDSWCPKLSTSNIPEPRKILDQEVIYKKKVAVGSSEYFQNLYQTSSPDKIYTKVIEVINSWLPPFLKTEKISEGNLFIEENLEDDFKKYIETVFIQIKNDLNETSETDTDILRNDYNALQKKYDELVVVNEDLNRQLDNLVNEGVKGYEEEEISSPKREESNDIKEKSEEQERQEPEDNLGELIFPDEEIQPTYIQEIEERRKELLKLKIGDLRKIGDGLNVPSTIEYKGNKNGKSELTNEILKLEFPKIS